jgi:hypothetical protein
MPWRRKFRLKFLCTTCPSEDTISKLEKKVWAHNILTDRMQLKRNHVLIQLSQFWTFFIVLSFTQNTMFWALASVFRWNPLSRVQQIKLICLLTSATSPLGFTKPTKYRPPMRINIFHTLNLHICEACGNCFMHNIVKNKIVSEQKSFYTVVRRQNPVSKALCSE